MAITNKAIIKLYKAENGIPESTPLFTFAAWKKQGYAVKAGEHARHKVSAWKYVQKAQEDGTVTGRCFMRTMCLFEAGQVERIKAKAEG